MKRIITLAIVLFLLIPTYARADNINGVEFDIPETWQLSDVKDHDSILIYLYTYGDEAITIMVGGKAYDNPDLASLNNLILLDCDTVYGEKENYILLTNMSEKTDDDLLTRYQECVYCEDQWYYIHLIATNTGSSAISMVYLSPTLSDQDQMMAFRLLASNYIPE